jgi:hypothetical protein
VLELRFRSALRSKRQRPSQRPHGVAVCRRRDIAIWKWQDFAAIATGRGAGAKRDPNIDVDFEITGTEQLATRMREALKHHHFDQSVQLPRALLNPTNLNMDAE